jgi:D-glycero-D-manno-heptose 1,7-bisphosphate phosphatase
VRFFDREGDGHVPRRLDRERRQLEGMLADASDFLQIHLQHYVINPTLEGQGYPYNYLEAEHLRTALVASRKVRLALSGHYHPGTDLLCEEGCYFCTAPAFTLAPHPMTIYHLEGGQVRREVVATQTGPLTAGKPVVFVDRDGVLNAQESYSTGPENLTLIAGAADAVARLRSAGWAVVVVTNQSAIGLGYVTESTVCLVNDRLCQLLSEQAGSEAIPDAIVMNAGAGSRAVHPMWQDLSRAKPSPWMLEQAVKELGLRQDGAFLVGDRESDLSAARTFGATPVLVRTGAGRETESSLDLRKWAALDIFDDLSTAVAMILSREG